MSMKKSMTLIAMGVGGTLMYQQIKNGNVKKYMEDMKRMALKKYENLYEDLEDMM